MEQGFERMKTDMGSIANDAEKMGKRINDVFSQMDMDSPIAAAREKIKALESQLEATSAELKVAISEDDDKSAERLGRKMTSLYDRLEAAREKLAREVTKAARKQAQEEEKAAERSRKAAEKEAKAQEKALQRAYREATWGARHFGARLREILSGALVFNIIGSGVRKMTSYFGEALKTNEQYRIAVGRLKGAFLTAFQYVYEYVLPIIIQFINYLTTATKAVVQFFASLSGKSASEMAANAEAMYSQAKGLESVSEEAEGAAKEVKKAKKELMGFDELNRLSEKETETKEKEKEEAKETADETIAPIFEELSDSIFSEFDIEKIKQVLTDVTVLLGTSLLAVGAIIAFSGANVPLGIALMAAGALSLGYTAITNWSAMKKALQGPIGIVFGLVSASVLVLGAILAFSGVNVPLGIAMMAIGAAGLATYWTANWDSIKNLLEGPIGAVTALVSAAALALGAILAFSGTNLPVGLVLMGLGAVGLVSSVAANWNTIKNCIKPVLSDLVIIISAALLAIGAVIAFSGANLALGIGLIAEGAIGLAATVKPDWSTIKHALEGPIGAMTAVISSALLVLGAILTFSGANLPLGIGLLVTGAAGLVSTASINWNTIRSKVITTISGIGAILSGSALVLGTILCLSGAGIPLGLPLIAAGIKGSVTAWNLDDNPLTRFVKNLANGIIKIINQITAAINDVFHIKFPGLKINGKQIIPSFDAKLMNIPRIPYLAQGAVIPPNAPFMAVLGDQRNGNNIEAPEDLIRKIVREESGGNSETLAVLRAILQAINDSGNTRITINGRDVFQAMVEENNRALRRTGSSPLKV